MDAGFSPVRGPCLSPPEAGLQKKKRPACRTPRRQHTLAAGKKNRLLTAGLHLRQGRGIVQTAAFGYARRLRLPATLPPAGKLAAGGM